MRTHQQSSSWFYAFLGRGSLCRSYGWPTAGLQYTWCCKAADHANSGCKGEDAVSLKIDGHHADDCQCNAGGDTGHHGTAAQALVDGRLTSSGRTSFAIKEWCSRIRSPDPLSYHPLPDGKQAAIRVPLRRCAAEQRNAVHNKHIDTLSNDCHGTSGPAANAAAETHVAYAKISAGSHNSHNALGGNSLPMVGLTLPDFLLDKLVCRVGVFRVSIMLSSCSVERGLAAGQVDGSGLCHRKHQCSLMRSGALARLQHPSA